jgi:hypothetical protein
MNKKLLSVHIYESDVTYRFRININVSGVRDLQRRPSRVRTRWEGRIHEHLFTIWDESENWEKARKRIQVTYSKAEKQINPLLPPGGIGP